jgi:hypothetical protein
MFLTKSNIAAKIEPKKITRLLTCTFRIRRSVMRALRFLLVFLFITALAIPGMGATALASSPDNLGNQHAPQGQLFAAVLLGKMETPPVQTDAHGVSLVMLNKDETALEYLVHVHHIENVTAAHIHCGAPGVPGPVVVTLFPKQTDSAMPPMMGTFTVTGMATEADITPVPDSEACPGGISSFAQLVEKMHSGEAYVNVHTEQNPMGEIRGQLMPIQHQPGLSE